MPGTGCWHTYCFATEGGASMTNPEAIVESLAQTARAAVMLAAAWHAVLAVALLALLGGWRPSQRAAGMLMSLPLASVAVSAAWQRNPFNAVLLGLGALSLVGLAFRLKNEAISTGSTAGRILGSSMIGLGWFYPHFNTGEPLSYFYAAPLGVLPCPTLAATIGLAIVARGFGSRAWSSALAGLGLFYGLFGTHVLGVFIDTFLTMGALVLLGLVWSRHGLPASQAPQA
jgi:hypothetical protein